MSDAIGVSIGGVSDDIVYQRLWIVTPAIAETIATMLDSMGFEKVSAMVPADQARAFGEQHIIGDF